MPRNICACFWPSTSRYKLVTWELLEMFNKHSVSTKRTQWHVKDMGLLFGGMETESSCLDISYSFLPFSSNKNSQKRANYCLWDTSSFTANHSLSLMGNTVAPSGTVKCGIRAQTKTLLAAEAWAPEYVSMSDLAVLGTSLGGEKVGLCSRVYPFSDKDGFLCLSPWVSTTVKCSFIVNPWTGLSLNISTTILYMIYDWINDQ